MQLTLNIDIPTLPRPISYADGILLTGSCFTEHMADRLGLHKFRVLSNPHGILFNPLSVASSLNGYIDDVRYTRDQLFYLNELWNSWDHHTRFSDIDADVALENINTSQAAAAASVRNAGWVIITLGSAFQYYLRETGAPVANNHRAPSQWFEKRLLTINTITDALTETLSKLTTLNPGVQVLFTISPVRHIRDGVVENNRSKARLIEAVHELCITFPQAFYFPAYELLIDVLRDYRFYDIDYVHPNFLATGYIWDKFVKHCILTDNHSIMEQVRELVTAAAHRPRFPATNAHQQFRKNYVAKTQTLMTRYPFLDLKNELDFFNS